MPALKVTTFVSIRRTSLKSSTHRPNSSSARRSRTWRVCTAPPPHRKCSSSLWRNSPSTRNMGVEQTLVNKHSNIFRLEKCAKVSSLERFGHRKEFLSPRDGYRNSSTCLKVTRLERAINVIYARRLGCFSFFSMFSKNIFEKYLYTNSLLEFYKMLPNRFLRISLLN